MPWRAVVFKSTFCATLVVLAEAVAATPDPVATPLVVNVEIDVPAMLSIDEEELALGEGNVPTEGIATVLNKGFSVPVVAVAKGLIVGALSNMAHISATALMVAVPMSVLLPESEAMVRALEGAHRRSPFGYNP